MRLTIAVLLLCICLIFEPVISEETCKLAAIEERLRALETRGETTAFEDLCAVILYTEKQLLYDLLCNYL